MPEGKILPVSIFGDCDFNFVVPEQFNHRDFVRMCDYGETWLQMTSILDRCDNRAHKLVP